RGFSAEVVVRLLVLKHARNWSYAVLEREVRANLIYRKFTRIGMAKMADAKTMGRWGVAVGPEGIKQIHDRVVSIAKEKGVAQGSKMRVDTTVVETNIHYPTDSSLLGDGVRVLTRVMKKITKITGEVGCKLRDRSRSVKHRVMEIGRAARAKGEQGKAKLHKPMPIFFLPRAGWSGKLSALPRKSSMGPSTRRAPPSRQRCGACGARLSRWYRACVKSSVKPERASSMARRAPKVRSSACSSRPPRSFAKGRPVSPTNLASSSSCRKRKIRS